MSTDKKLVLIAHNLRSCHNVGSLLRTAEGLGVPKVVLSGYTPYPLAPGDSRLPHEAQKIHKQIHKTALGAETQIAWEHADDIFGVLERLRSDGFQIFALEQTPQAIALPGFKAPDRLALIVGREVEGIEPEVLAAADGSIVIPMKGKKESFNVAQAAAMALYHCTFVKPTP